MSGALFKDIDAKEYTKNDFINALKSLGADKAKILYIHTDIGFAKPLLKRKELIANLYDAITSLGVKTIIFPTFTFSFCNKEIYDVKNSKTTMGALNEYARTREGVFRTLDPLMSVCVIGEVPDELKNISKYSCGKGGGSAFELMSKSDENMFLFFGAKPTECFTFLHYVEAVRGVPYRYDREFSGTVVDENQNSSNQTFILPTLYDTVIPEVKMEFQNRLENKGILKRIKITTQRELMLVKAKSAFEEILKCLDEDINMFLARPYDAYELGTSYNHTNVKSVK